MDQKSEGTIPKTSSSNLEEGTKVQSEEASKYYNNVNIVGGHCQTEPVRIVVENENNADVENIGETVNLWSRLKKRQMAFRVTKVISSALNTGSVSAAAMTKLFHENPDVAAEIYSFMQGETLQRERSAAVTINYEDLAKRFVLSMTKAGVVTRGGTLPEYKRLRAIVAAMVARSFKYAPKDFTDLATHLDEQQIDYIDKMLKVLGLSNTPAYPFNMIELIWSYWMEEGMLVQTMNAISRRFQNIRNGDRDPLVNLTIDPLRGAGNLLWGYIQDAPNRLTVQRRSFEYENHYGLRLIGSAVPQMSSADSRSKFIGSFNSLLLKCAAYYKQADNTMIKADGFPLLNALQELHLILAEGANNQFGNLPLEARIEMMVEQQILAREEIREFLSSRPMMPYREEWMGRVDAMKKLQRWDPTGIIHFYDLANFGEILLLSIRLVNWSDINSSETAGKWAIFFRNEIQKYVFSYRTVTGVDLSSEQASSPEQRETIPGILIQQRLRRS